MKPTDLTTVSALRGNEENPELTSPSLAVPPKELQITQAELKERQGWGQAALSALHSSKVAGHAYRELRTLEANAMKRTGALAIELAEDHLRKTMVSQSQARNQHLNEKLLTQTNVSQVRVLDIAAAGMNMLADRYAARCAIVDQQYRDGVIFEVEWRDQRKRLQALMNMVANASDNAAVATVNDGAAGFAKALRQLND